MKPYFTLLTDWRNYVFELLLTFDQADQPLNLFQFIFRVPAKVFLQRSRSVRPYGPQTAFQSAIDLGYYLTAPKKEVNRILSYYCNDSILGYKFQSCIKVSLVCFRKKVLVTVLVEGSALSY